MEALGDVYSDSVYRTLLLHKKRIHDQWMVLSLVQEIEDRIQNSNFMGTVNVNANCELHYIECPFAHTTFQETSCTCSCVCFSLNNKVDKIKVLLNRLK